MQANTLLDSPKLFRIIKYLVSTLVLLVFISYLNHPRARDTYVEILRSFKDEKRLFIADFLEHEIDGSFDGRELAKLCASKTWFPEEKAVIVGCQPVPGGVSEVKNGHLHCIRFAIEIGAQLILPRVTQRSPADIAIIHGEQHSKGHSLDYYFSVDHLVTSLRNHCPQMKVHRSLDDLYDKPSLLAPLDLALNQLTWGQFANVDGIQTTIMSEPGMLKPRFDELMDRELPREKRRYPVRVQLQETLFAWPTRNDSEAFRRDFGRLLRVREDVRVLAASGLWNLARRHGLPLDHPRDGIGGQKSGDGDGRAGFVGVHLRTERDAQMAAQVTGLRFPDYNTQSAYFLNSLRYLDEDIHLGAADAKADANANANANANGNGNKVVYLATGLTAADDDVRTFRREAAELKATVVTKRDVLDPAEVNILNNRLTWDQRALVDYEIMMRAGLVLGVVESSLAWNLALRRGNAYGGGGQGAFVAGTGGEAREQAADWNTEDMVMWRDRYSILFGKSDRAVSMYLGIWP